MKIIQILIAPDGYTWQHRMHGLGDDGNVYVLNSDGWMLVVKSSDISKDESEEVKKQYDDPNLPF